MKKKIFCSLILFAMLLTCGAALAETATATGIWTTRFFVDEFDLPTDESYISNDEPIVGKFSNSATTDSDLLVYIYVVQGENSDYVSVYFKLIEYGSNVVKNAYSKPQAYNVVMMDTDGEKYYFDGYMLSGNDFLTFMDEDCKTIIDALCENGTVRFAIIETENTTTEYIFTIEATAGILDFFPYTSVGYFSEGLATVSKLYKAGFIDTTGNLVIPFEYELTKSFSEGLACVAKNGKYGFIDTAGNTIVPCEYDYAASFSEGLAGVQKEGKWGFVDKTGNLAIPCEYDESTWFFEEGYAGVKKEGKWGSIDYTGNLAIPCEFDYAISFREGLSMVIKDEKWGFIDYTGSLVIPYEYDYANSFSGGLAPVCLNGKYGYIDTTGSLVVPCEYDDANVFTEGLACVKKDDKYGYIDLNGTLVIPHKYNLPSTIFYEGLADISIDDEVVFIDTAGQFIVSYERGSGNKFHRFSEGYFPLLKDGEITIFSRDEVQPNWKEELDAHEAGVRAQEQARKLETEMKKLLKEYTEKETIKNAQTALNEAGYDCGKPDGIAGKGTAVAVTQYQTDKGLNITGTITHELLISLGLIES